MEVVLGGFYVGVTTKLGDDGDIDAGLESECGKGVSRDVKSEVFVDPSCCRPTAEVGGNDSARHEGEEVVGGFGEIAWAKESEGIIAERDTHFAVRLDLNFVDDKSVGSSMKVVPGEGFDVGEAQASVASKKESSLGAVVRARSLGEELDFVGGEAGTAQGGMVRQQADTGRHGVGGNEALGEGFGEQGTQGLQIGASTGYGDLFCEVAGEMETERGVDFVERYGASGEGRQVDL